ncbi:MAG TPA: ATP-binding cassette domain-containing protein, partial [Paracoccaceae bacterium]|nr:ATP-binding cassette domain-containing protein [Paracoccaceae bacterium]
LDAGERSGRLVIEAKNIAKSWGETPIVRDFSIRIARGERIALVGPNGVGKTTLLNLLTGQEAPDSGTVRIGANVEMSVFDQARAQLDPEKSLWDSLTDDRDLGAKGDQIMVRGQPRHVVAYLKDFLFDDAQARGPVKALSGGERARLLLARIMARPANLLVLDEPTNDLDIETLDLLQELIADFDGTVLLVSHDRDFIDRVATTTIAMEGDGRATIYAGGWSDYRAQAGNQAAEQVSSRPARKPAPRPREAQRPAPRAGLSFTQRHRLEALPKEIERLTDEIGKLEALLSDPDLYASNPARFEKASEALVLRQKKLDEAETEWLELEELREKAG